MDQEMVSIRIAEWMQRSNFTNIDQVAYKVSDQGFSRLDRPIGPKWQADQLNETTFQRLYDAHMPLKSFLPSQWNKIKPLVSLMYGGSESFESQWCNEYVRKFYKRVKNKIMFTDSKI